MMYEQSTFVKRLNGIKIPFPILGNSTSYLIFSPSIFVVQVSFADFGQEFDCEVLLFPWENVGTLC